MANKTKQSDEEIIDLTELIEPGHAPASGTRVAAGGFEDLLAQADAGDTPRGSSPKQGPVVDPHEELDMLNMGDIDNLLETLDIPAQPRESGGSAAPGKGGADMDSVLDGLLGADEAPPASPRETPPDSFASALDDILNEDDDPPPARPGSAAPGKPQTSASKAPPSSVSDDLDALLGSEVPAARESAPQKPEMPASPKPEPAADLDADLDALIGSFDKEGKSPAPRAEPSPADANLDAELDDILSAVETPPPPAAPGPAQKPAASPVTEPNASEELEALLEQEAPVKTPPPARHTDEVMAETPAFLGKTQPQQGISSELIADICQKIVAARDSGDTEALTSFSRQLGAQAAHLEDLGRQTGELGRRLTTCEDKLSACMARLAKLEKSVEAAATIEDLLKDGEQLHEGFKTLIASAVSNAMQGFAARENAGPELLSRFARIDADSREAGERIGLLENRLLEFESGAELANAGQDANARIEEFENRLAALESSVNAGLEAAGAAAGERIAMLEKRLDELEANASAELANAGKNVDARIELLERRLSEFEAGSSGAELPPDALKKMGQLESGARGADARIALLEKRLDELEPNFNLQVEKAAASAAARILHEEIGKLVGGQ